MFKSIVGLVSATVLAVSGSLVVATPAEAAVKVYTNCTALNKKYKHGAGIKGAKDKVKSGKKVTNFTVISSSFYNANKKLDRDKDKILCEKK